jgi:uncharacterized SAM-binding protein YcdF (DUF218 family)
VFKRIRNCLLCAFGVLTLGGIVAAIALLYAGSWLKLATSPREADAIVVLAGAYERSLYAADLYNQHLAPKVYVSVPVQDPGARKVEALGIPLPHEFEVHRQVLMKKGVPAGNIHSFGTANLSTAEEAEELRKLLAAKSERLLVVTSPYQARRAKLIFDRAFEGSGANITVVATPYEDFPDEWWRSQSSARNTVLELTKIAWFHLGGRFRSAAE